MTHIPVKLTQREMEVFQAVAHGMSTKEIAAMLFISVNTAKVHRHNIIKKTGCGNMTEAVAAYLRLHIIS